MVTKILWLLWQFNPLRPYFERRDRAEKSRQHLEQIALESRAEERQAFLQALKSLEMVAVEAAKASQTQAGVLKSYLDSFQVAAQPSVRFYDPEQDDERYMQEHLPEQLRGLTPQQQKDLLLQRLEFGE